MLQAVDETAGSVGRTRLSQILRGSAGQALLAAGHDRLGSYGLWPGGPTTRCFAASTR